MYRARTTKGGCGSAQKSANREAGGKVVFKHRSEAHCLVLLKNWKDGEKVDGRDGIRCSTGAVLFSPIPHPLVLPNCFFGLPASGFFVGFDGPFHEKINSRFGIQSACLPRLDGK